MRTVLVSLQSAWTQPLGLTCRQEARHWPVAGWALAVPYLADFLCCPSSLPLPFYTLICGPEQPLAVGGNARASAGLRVHGSGACRVSLSGLPGPSPVPTRPAALSVCRHRDEVGVPGAVCVGGAAPLRVTLWAAWPISWACPSPWEVTPCPAAPRMPCLMADPVPLPHPRAVGSEEAVLGRSQACRRRTEAALELSGELPWLPVFITHRRPPRFPESPGRAPAPLIDTKRAPARGTKAGRLSRQRRSPGLREGDAASEFIGVEPPRGSLGCRGQRDPPRSCVPDGVRVDGWRPGDRGRPISPPAWFSLRLLRFPAGRGSVGATFGVWAGGLANGPVMWVVLLGKREDTRCRAPAGTSHCTPRLSPGCPRRCLAFTKGAGRGL